MPHPDPPDTTAEAAVKPDIRQEQAESVANLAEHNQPQALEDPYFRKLTDQSVHAISAPAMSRLRNPMHPGRHTLQERLCHETPEETFLHLSDMDGVAMVYLKMGSISFVPGDYDSDIAIMTRLTPLRKFLQDVREDPKKLVPFLKQQLIEFSRLQQKKCEEFARLMEDANGMVVTPGLPEDTQDLLRSTAAVYVLSEIGAYEALPTLAWLSALPLPLKTANAQYTRTVSKKFLFYAMHLLVTGLPEDSLSQQAIQARHQYLALAEMAQVPEPTRVKVTSWDAYYHEQDFRRTTLRKKLNTNAEPTIQMTRYPTLHIEEHDVEPLLAALREFTQLVFPDANVLQ
jgi:hypothetical protein